MAVQQISGVTRGQVFRQAGKARDIGEHHGHVLLARLDPGIAAFLDDPTRQLGRHVCFKPSQTRHHGIEGNCGVLQLPQTGVLEAKLLAEVELSNPPRRRPELLGSAPWTKWTS